MAIQSEDLRRPFREEQLRPTMASVAAFAFLFFLLPSIGLAQQIYKWKDENGQWRFSQTPPPDAAKIEEQSQGRATISCSTFKPGEIRQAGEYPPSPEFPHLMVVDLQVRLLESKKERATFSWKMVVRNSSVSRDTVRGALRFMDCKDFPLAKDAIGPEAAPPGQETTITGTKTISGPVAGKVGRFGVSLTGAASKAKAPLSSAAKKKPSPANLKIISARIEGAPPETYFTGKIVNSGSSVAPNVRVSFTIKTVEGVVATRSSVVPKPADIPPGGEAFFKQRVGLTGSSRYTWSTELDWTK